MEWCLLLLGLVVFAQGSGSAAVEKLFLLTMFPYPSDVPSQQPSWSQGTNILPAAYLAADLINNSSDILGGYTLELINSDGGCDIVDNARISVVRHVIAQPGQKPLVGIIGPGCSSSTLAVSSHLSHRELALINLHLAGTPLIENRRDFAYSLGVLGSSYGFVNATVALMRKANWKRIAVLYDEERTFFLSTYQALERDLQLYVPDAQLAFTSAVYDTYFPIADIVELDIRVIIVLTGEEFARKIMCLGAYEEITYPRYQWIWMGRSTSEFEENISFTYIHSKYSCSNRTLLSALVGSLFVNYQLKRSDNNVTKANITYDQYWDLYNERVKLYNDGLAKYKAPGDPSAYAETNRYATIVFDAVWAFALAMHKAAKTVNLTSYGLQLGRFEESNIIRDILYNHTFEGVSGHISFEHTNGYTQRLMEVLQVYEQNNYTPIGYIVDQVLIIRTTPSLVPDEFRESLQLVNDGVALALSLLTATIVVLNIALHILSILYRDHPSIKAQSPKLSQISYVGFYIFAVGTLLSTMYKAIDLDRVTYGNICQAIWPWFFSISFSVFFAPICARTWRLYRIFAHYLNPGPFISEPVLFSFIALVVTIDVLLAIIWTSLDPLQGEELKFDYDGNGDFSLRLSCDCQYTVYWFSAVYLLKFILLLTTVVLSVLTRGITNEKFKTSFLRVFVYLFALIWAIGLPLYYFLSYQSLNIYFDYITLALMCNALLLFSVLFVFLPPTFPLFKEKLHPLTTGKYFIDQMRSQPHLSSK
jgi:ABC-type branched-subunit amino acid transport system substrate-binding protein